jgi:hypothetical protein
MSVIYLCNIRKVIRGIATGVIIPDNLHFCNLKRGRDQNPINAMAPGIPVKIVLRGRFRTLGIKSPPGVLKTVARTGQFLEDRVIRGFIEVPYQYLGRVFVLKEFPDETGAMEASQ